MSVKWHQQDSRNHRFFSIEKWCLDDVLILWAPAWNHSFSSYRAVHGKKPMRATIFGATVITLLFHCDNWRSTCCSRSLFLNFFLSQENHCASDTKLNGKQTARSWTPFAEIRSALTSKWAYNTRIRDAKPHGFHHILTLSWVQMSADWVSRRTDLGERSPCSGRKPPCEFRWRGA